MKRIPLQDLLRAYLKIVPNQPRDYYYSLFQYMYQQWNTDDKRMFSEVKVSRIG